MADDVDPPCVDELDMLRSMAADLRAGGRVNSPEVERRLEAGFGALIGLEAELARVQRASGPEPTAQAADSASIKHRISELRDALTDLRTLAVQPGESRVGYGFVLPGHQQHLQVYSN